MFKRFSVFVGVLALCASSFAQTLTWKNLTSMYVVNGVATSGNYVYAATSGGVFIYSLLTDSLREYTTTEGLSNIFATSVATEKPGFVLVGESNGMIDEIDSSGVVHRSQADIAASSSLQKQVSRIAVSGDTAFACTPFGVVLISLATFQTLDSYTHFVTGSSTPALGAAIFRGSVYIASSYGISTALRSAVNLAAPDLWRMTDPSVFDNGATCIAAMNGYLYAGTSSGLYFSSDGSVFQQVAGVAGSIVSLSASRDLLIVNENSGAVGVGSNNSIRSLYGGGVSLSDAACYNDTLLIGGTTTGLLLSGSSVRYVVPPGPATNVISNMSVDGEGDLWCSTSSNDVGTAFMEYDGKSWHNYNTNNTPSLPVNNFYEISAVCGDYVVAGSWGFGAAVLHDGLIKIFNRYNSSLYGEPNNIDYVLVGDAACDSRGNIWMANPLANDNNPLAVFSPQDSTWYSFKNTYTPPSGFQSIAIDPYGGVWTGDATGERFVTTYHGVFYYNANGTLSNGSDDISYNITSANGLLSNQVNALKVDNEGQVWIGTPLGLNVIYNPDPSYTPDLTSVSSIYSLLDQNINGIDYDALDDKWVAASTGVYEISKDGNTPLHSYNTTDSPLPDDNVTAIACDRSTGTIYFATSYGITSLHMGAVQPLSSFGKLKISPNPVRLPVRQPVQIDGLEADSHVKIFSVDGKLIDEFDAQGGRIAYWNGTDLNGNQVSSGIYIVVASSSDGSQNAVSKIAVIRQ